MSRHFFVFGIARSGTNLLARMIDRHPAAVCALDPLLPYFKFLRNGIVDLHAPAALRETFSPNAPLQDYYFQACGPALLDLLFESDGQVPLPAPELEYLRTLIVDRAALESPLLAEALTRTSGTSYKDFLDDVLRIIGQSKQGALWSGAKEVWAIDFLPVLSRMYPEAHFFLIERDPRAIVASLLAMAEQDASQAAHFISYVRHWRKAVALGRQFASDGGMPERVQIVSYERLVREPALVAQEVCAQLSLEYRAEMLEVSSAGWAGNSSYGDNRGIYGQSLEKWRKLLNRATASAIDFVCAPEMTLTAYQTASDQFGRLTPAIEGVFRTVNMNQASWRSDSGHVALDLGAELLRYEMLKSGEEYQTAAVRECFLSASAFRQMRENCREKRV